MKYVNFINIHTNSKGIWSVYGLGNDEEYFYNTLPQPKEKYKMVKNMEESRLFEPLLVICNELMPDNNNITVYWEVLPYRMYYGRTTLAILDIITSDNTHITVNKVYTDTYTPENFILITEEILAYQTSDYAKSVKKYMRRRIK